MEFHEVRRIHWQCVLDTVLGNVNLLEQMSLSDLQWLAPQKIIQLVIRWNNVIALGALAIARKYFQLYFQSQRCGTEKISFRFGLRRKRPSLIPKGFYACLMSFSTHQGQLAHSICINYIRCINVFICVKFFVSCAIFLIFL